MCGVIVVDAGRSRCTCHRRDAYIRSCLDNLIIIRFSINCSTVICSPTVILMLSWEKPLVKPMAPGSISYHISFQSTFICIFTFCIYIIKCQKYIYLIILSLLDLTFTSGREGIDNPFIVLVASSCLFEYVCGTFEEPPTGLIPWFSKLREILMLLLLHHPFLFKENQRKLKT